MRRHLKIVHEGKYPLAYEKKMPLDKDKCNEISSVHEENKAFEYPCKICNRGFAQRSHMRRHVRRVHQEPVSQWEMY